jgi:hypothetical protein
MLLLTSAGFAGGHKGQVAGFDVDRAAFETEQGKREYTELKNLKQQLKTRGTVMNDADRNNLQSQIESKLKSFDASFQDFKRNVQDQRIDISKMASIVVRLARKEKLYAVVDTSSGAGNDSNQPGVRNAEVLWSATAEGLEKAATIEPELDITDMVVSEYNSKYP